MKITFVLTLFLASMSLQAQELTKVRFYVKGSSDYFIQVDGELLPHSNLQSIIPGEHKLEIWSPMYLPYTGKLIVPEKDSISYFQKLERDPEYVKYLFQSDEFNRKLFLGKTVPLLAAGLGTVSAPILYFLRKRDHETLVKENFRAAYFGGQEAAETAQTRYAVSNGLFFTSTALAVGGTLTYFLLKKKLDEMQKPVYKQKNPFTLEDFELSYHPIMQVPQAGVTLSF